MGAGPNTPPGTNPVAMPPAKVGISGLSAVMVGINGRSGSTEVGGAGGDENTGSFAAMGGAAGLQIWSLNGNNGVGSP